MGSTTPSSSLKSLRVSTLLLLCFGLAAIVRIALIVYANWQDNNMVVKYTDIDYEVITDGSRFVTQSQSPYMRSTYRYTPLLAYMLTLNIWIHKIIGKLIFMISDLLIGWFLYLLLKAILDVNGKYSKDELSRRALFYTSFWLFNPFSVNVSTRGNAESIVGLLVIWTLYLLIVKNNIYLGGLIYGLAIHFKIYPIVYCLALFFFIGSDSHYRLLKRVVKKQKQQGFFARIISLFFHKDRITFALLTVITLAALSGIFYIIYGYEFLYETYLYHIWRKDNRHNLSLYFYDIYLKTSSDHIETSLIIIILTAMASFLPQMMLILAATFKYYQDITFCVFIQTMIFVAFNKVCTVQYFCWYLSILPLILPFTNMKIYPHAISLFSIWLATLLSWFYFGYLLEFESVNTFYQLWISGALYFIANMFVIRSFIKYHTTPLNTLKKM